MSHRFLVAVDDSPSAQRTVEYVAERVRHATDAHVELVTWLKPFPPDIMEHGGREHPAEEAHAEKTMEREKHAYVSKEAGRARPFLDRWVAHLVETGVAAERISVRCLPCIPEETISQALRREVENDSWDTVVVGRSVLPWYREIFHTHLGEELARKLDDVALWLVP